MFKIIQLLLGILFLSSLHVPDTTYSHLVWEHMQPCCYYMGGTIYIEHTYIWSHRTRSLIIIAHHYIDIPYCKLTLDHTSCYYSDSGRVNWREVCVWISWTVSQSRKCPEGEKAIGLLLLAYCIFWARSRLWCHRPAEQSKYSIHGKGEVSNSAITQ